jgi:hypothetical protein
MSGRRFYLLLFANRTEISVFTQEPKDEDIWRTYWLFKGEMEVGTVTILKYQPLRIALHLPLLFVGGGTSLCFLDLNSLKFGCRDLDYELLAVYPVPAGWCLIEEIAVRVVAEPGGPIISSFSHDEVILRHWWEGDTLCFEDLQAREYCLDLTTAPHLIAVERKERQALARPRVCSARFLGENPEFFDAIREGSSHAAFICIDQPSPRSMLLVGCQTAVWRYPR